MERKGFLRRHLLSAVCFTLHLVLVLVHVAVLIGTIKEWEHRFIFPLGDQTTVSFWTTVITQSFGTILTATLVFLTQRLAMQRNVGPHRTLTATHDSLSSWAGLGSALVTLFNQVSVPASVFGTFNIVGYLGCISILHITIPAILSVETSNTTVSVPGITFGIPEYANSTAINSTRDFMRTFPTNFLPWSGVFDDSQMLGLSNGSLYESPGGEARVSAIGFNITCGYVSAQVDHVDAEPLDESETGFDLTVNSVPSHFYSYSQSLLPNTLSIFDGFSYERNQNDSVYLSTTTIVVDSQGNQGSPLIFNQQSLPILKNLTKFDLNSSQIQFLQCSKSLVPQSATIDSQSNTIISGSLSPNLHKNQSTWVPAADLNFITHNATLLGGDLVRELIVQRFLASTLSHQWSDILTESIELGPWSWSSVDQYLMSYLGLDPSANVSSESVVLQLHDIENALSNILAMIFWTGEEDNSLTGEDMTQLLAGGHVALDPWYLKYSHSAGLEQAEAGTIPVLLSGRATINQQDASNVRLNSNLIAVILGLATSITLMVLCFAFLRIPAGPNGNTGAGLLYTIWLWRNQAQFSNPLRDIQQPTETNLRKTGLIPLDPDTKEREYANISRQDTQNSLDKPFFRSSTLLGTIHASFSRTEHLIMCIPLHILLVVAYLILLGFAVSKKEHNIIFPIGSQQTVSFVCKVATTAFGTIYYTLLVYLTQRLAVAHAIRKYSLLTATHDKVVAWTGIGSAVSTLDLLYLALLSNNLSSTRNNAGHCLRAVIYIIDLHHSADPGHAAMVGYPKQSAAFLPWIGIGQLDESRTLGLSGGSLYNVLTKPYPGSPITEVPAIGFNITCGYISDATVKKLHRPKDEKETGVQDYNVSFPTEGIHWAPWANVPDPNTILIAHLEQELPTDPIILYTQNSVADSHGKLGSPVTLPHSNVTLQFIQCFKSLVHQMGRVDPGSRKIMLGSLYPPIDKSNSTWQAYNTNLRTVIEDKSSILEGDYWAQILSPLDAPDILFMASGWSVDWGSMYLMQQLGLKPVDSSNPAEGISQPPPGSGERENVHPSGLAMEDLEANDDIGPNHTPVLSTGSTTVQQLITGARLDASIGVGASILLLILVFVFAAGTRISDPYLTSLGFLQVIWVFEHHPELSEVLKQVEDPTDYNLRIAGMVKAPILGDARLSRLYMPAVGQAIFWVSKSSGRVDRWRVARMSACDRVLNSAHDSR
ncbi:hypothetical protein DFH08DRAFT_1016976 [Mycena albidolilacea]|uniref:Uncharacterized protein n=1 Tax=Mycena albidolilacea TaxID=1033008 RepID=A0AAD7F465_9AGAR|nr:hypothetical protein DFH08DRAFT_1016976 [Mycena albidolilacea]